MGSIMDSRYWTCPSCFNQFDWNSKTSNPTDHDEKTCRKTKPKPDPQRWPFPVQEKKGAAK